ncbi:MAG: hypothetical protein JRF63_07115 [Deltaproteobacteria bacterium]|nr:hypothetical protein [Deltaproteobacteria bacterium]
MTAQSTDRSGLIFERQWAHLTALGAMLTGLWFSREVAGLDQGSLWGASTPVWLWLAVGCAVGHQVFVLLAWRTELHLGLVTRLLGSAGFNVYALVFAILGLARVALVFLVSIANSGTLPLPAVPLKVGAVLLAIPALYTFYSVKRWFGFRRALGIDHFDPEYRNAPLVRQGIHRLTSNGMYVYGFLILWVPALWWGSTAGLAAAVFNHVYIWVHYYVTEKPDMKRIYGERPQSS